MKENIIKYALYKLVIVIFCINITNLYAVDGVTSAQSDDNTKAIMDTLEVFKVYYRYFDEMIFVEQPNLRAGCGSGFTRRHDGWCYYDEWGVLGPSLVQDMFCDKPYVENLDSIRKEIKEKIKYTIIKPEQKKCFCWVDENQDVKKYRDNSDECIFMRRKTTDYKDIYYFDYKKHLPSDLQHITPSMFKEYTKKYLILEDIRRTECLGNMDLISTEREACSKKLDIYMEDLIYERYKKCLNRPILKEYGRSEVKKGEIIFEVENKCIL